MSFIEDARKRLHAPKSKDFSLETKFKLEQMKVLQELNARGIPLDSAAGNIYLGSLTCTNPKLYGVITE